MTKRVGCQIFIYGPRGGTGARAAEGAGRGRNFIANPTANVYILRAAEVLPSLLSELIRDAQESVYIEQQYIVAGGPKTQALLEELAARKGPVEIRIIVSPAYPENWEKTKESLEAAGLLDCLRAINLDSFTHLHNKGVLVDGRYSVVTSTNMSENSITQAREAGVLIDSGEIGAYYRAVFDVDCETGIDPADVVNHLATVSDVLDRVEEATVEIHPADLRMI